MNTLEYCLAAAIVASPMALMAAPAAAQINESWVSISGNDGNTCTESSPCRLFQAAFAKTSAGGTIRCMDSGYFAGLAINKSITISCKTDESTAGPGFFQINTPGIKVTLRGLTLDAPDYYARPYGVRILHPSTVILEDVVLRGASDTNLGFGVMVENTTGTVELSMKDSVASDNRVGIRIAPTGNGIAKVAISNSYVTDNGAGIQAAAPPRPAGLTYRSPTPFSTAIQIRGWLSTPVLEASMQAHCG